MWTRLVIGGAIGLVAGGVLGYFGKCRPGGCPLTGSPWSGAIFGCLIGVVVAMTFFRGGGKRTQGVGEEEFDRALADHGTPVLVDFYADWCGPCRTLAPTIAKIADEYAGRARVLKVNVDDEKALAQRYGISSIPTIIVFVRGEPFSRMGSEPLESYRKVLDSAIELLKSENGGATSGPAEERE